MRIRCFLTSLALSATILGMAACSAGPGSGFVPAAPHAAAVSRTAKDETPLHP